MARHPSKSGPAIEVTGAKELERAFQELPVRVENKVLGQALRAAGKPLVQTARKKLRKNQPNTSIGGREVGLYKKAIKAQLLKKKRAHVRLLRVNADPKVIGRELPSNISNLIEYGHSGPAPAPPKPHLRPAFDEKGQEAIRILQEKALASLEKEAKRLATKNKS